jgi:threonine dehydrogenase-like Zn-dependent dehydrogenase
MRALVCSKPPRVVERPEPVRAPDEALVRVRLAGVCDTDLELAKGYMGFEGVLGHEFVGEVLESDDASWRGRRVVADINAGCGACADCKAGNAHHCATRTVLGIVGRDGALAERTLIPERCLVAVPDAVPDDQAVFAEPLAAALHVLDDLPAGKEPVIVLGDGKLGQLIVRALLSAERPVVLVGHHEEKLVMAREAGAIAILEQDLGEDHAGMCAVVEATGSAGGIALALSLARPRGTVILKTTVAGKTSVDLSPAVIHELKIVGSRCGDLERAVAVLERGRVDPTNLIAARYPLSAAEEALAHAGRKGTLKVLVDT